MQPNLDRKLASLNIRDNAKKKLSIFISHPSGLLTNHRPHGDGLIAFGFLHRLADRGHQIHIVGPSVETISSIDIQGEVNENITIYPLDNFTPYETLNPIEYLIKVRQVFRQVDRLSSLDIIHQFNPVNPGLSYSLIGQGKPIVLGPFWSPWLGDAEPPQYRASFLGSISSSITLPLMNWLGDQQRKQASVLLVSSRAAVDHLNSSGSLQKTMKFLTPGIDTRIFHPTKNISPGSNSLSILYLASLSQRKGIFTLLNAFERVAKSFPTCRLVIAGTGPELSSVKDYISATSWQQQAHILGAVSREQVPQVMQQCTVYCLPSYGEPFGMSALEAMACGKPVVATNLGGLADLVPDQGGREVPVKDPQALAAALIEILASPELQRSMGEYNRQQVESYYSWDKIIDRLEEIYYGLVSKAA